MYSQKETAEELAPVRSASLRIGSLEAQVTHDEVFGEITRDGPNYRNVGWLGTVALMMKTQIGLGVLSIPAAFDVLGLIPGLIILITIAAITTWSNYIVGVFKLLHPGVYSLDDAGAMIFGRAGRYFFATTFCLYWVLVAGSGMLSISIALNAVSTHGACTAIFVAIAALVGFAFSSIQTLGRITWLAWIGLVGILTARALTLSIVTRRSLLAQKTANLLPNRSSYYYNSCWCSRSPGSRSTRRPLTRLRKA